MIKIINYFLQSLLIYFFFFLIIIIRLRLSRFLFSHIFSFIGPFLKSKKIIENNLSKFSKNNFLEKKEIIKNMWKNYGMTFVEYMFLDYFKSQNSHISLKGDENLAPAINGKPVIFISGHFANFELMSMEITKKKIKLATIYRPLNNIFLNPLMEYLRRKYICKNQIKKGIKGVREAINYIKRGHSIALMIDQRVSEGEKVNFFGQTALTSTLPAQLASKYNLDIIPVSIERKDNDRFLLEFHNVIKPDEFKNKLEITEKLNLHLEKMIIKNPGQWIWTHNRWK